MKRNLPKLTSFQFNNYDKKCKLFPVTVIFKIYFVFSWVPLSTFFSQQSFARPSSRFYLQTWLKLQKFIQIKMNLKKNQQITKTINKIVCKNSKHPTLILPAKYLKFLFQKLLTIRQISGRVCCSDRSGICLHIKIVTLVHITR